MGLRLTKNHCTSLRENLLLELYGEPWAGDSDMATLTEEYLVLMLNKCTSLKELKLVNPNIEDTLSDYEVKNDSLEKLETKTRMTMDYLTRNSAKTIWISWLTQSIAYKMLRQAIWAAAISHQNASQLF